jgi:hypothetical protein
MTLSRRAGALGCSPAKAAHWPKGRCEMRGDTLRLNFADENVAFDIDYGSIHFLPFPVVSLS